MQNRNWDEPEMPLVCRWLQPFQTTKKSTSASISHWQTI